MLITVSNTLGGPTGLALEITEGGIKYTLRPDSGPSPNKLTALLKSNARPFDHKKDASYNYRANCWTPAKQVLSGWWGSAPAPTGPLGPGSSSPQLSFEASGLGDGLWMWKISLPFCAGGF
jgi:hypothetical protein